MSRPLFIMLGGIASVLAATIAIELSPAQTDPVAAIVPIRHPPRAAAPAAPSMDHSAQWAATALARPLFNPDRRPPKVAAAAGPSSATDNKLPRLTGIMVSPIGRAAIFAPGGNAKPVVVGVGGAIGAWSVKKIELGAVTVAGPDGERSLQPAFDKNRVVPSVASVEPPGADNGQPPASIAATDTPPRVPGMPSLIRRLQRESE